MSEAGIDLTPAEREQLGRAALAWALQYFTEQTQLPIYPSVSARELTARLSHPLPNDPQDPAAVIADFDAVATFGRHNGHPRMFGYVQSPGVAVAALADLLASTLNANLTAWRSAPGPAEIEHLAIEWVRALLGLPLEGAGVFVSGGSMANLSALLVARRAKAPVDVARLGARALPRAMRLYVSAETHHSVARAATLIGIGSDHVRVVPVDAAFRMRLDALETMIEEDVHAGHQPFAVVGSAGTVGTGAIDPLAGLAAIARRHALWFHVDASYGGFAALAPAVQSKLAAFAAADSIALDPHKWLYLPLDCGCLLVRDAGVLRATFAHDAEYTRVIDSAPAESFAFWDWTPELSRRFRALKVWMTLRACGAAAMRAAVEKDLACAARLAAAIDAAADFERLAPIELSIVCFRHVPEAARAALAAAPEPVQRERVERALDAWNERLLVAVQRDGGSYLSNAGVAGRFALRACVMNHRTTLEDMDRLLADVRRVAAVREAFAVAG